MRIAPKINLSDEDRKTLERWARGRSTPARLVLRAKTTEGDTTLYLIYGRQKERWERKTRPTRQMKKSK